MKNVAVLGCTGSIGRQTLDVIRANPNEFQAIAICAGRDADRVAAQAAEFNPEYIAMEDEAAADKLKSMGVKGKIISGTDASCMVASLEQADIIVNGISGYSGMKPLLAALEAGKPVALANKESIVCAHGLVKEALELYGGKILPVDSEQSAIFQCLAAGSHGEIDRLILTASGGPFRTYTKEQLDTVTPEQAGNHPTWNMGRKITIDSATLFNKGLEIMEASYLFDVPGDRISVLVHPESIVHSMVEFVDGCTMAQLSKPDMRLAIQYALTYPQRTYGEFGRLRLEETGRLTFYAPDRDKFPALDLAYEALKDGQRLPIAYNGANEVAVELFLQEKIKFTDIWKVVEYTMAHMDRGEVTSLEDIEQTDKLARELAFRKGK
ncbi:MAG: 1-deoxy-D-xylulose-5-phosphate reductoisomerase [Clostridia bacterium]|nr:1-deoxy-D-xylulose-5-phosphate reductoisomerase [Clostridia bacterium]